MGTNQEGARGFATILAQIGDGVLHSELSEKLQALNTVLFAHAEKFSNAKGEITLTLKLSMDSMGTTDVTSEIKVKEPKRVSPKSVFWLSKGNNLVNENPKQTKLPLREVSASGKQEPRDVPATDVRNV